MLPRCLCTHARARSRSAAAVDPVTGTRNSYRMAFETGLVGFIDVRLDRANWLTGRAVVAARPCAATAAVRSARLRRVAPWHFPIMTLDFSRRRFFVCSCSGPF